MAKNISTSENVAYYHNVKYSSIQQLHKTHKMHGVKRVIAFCIFIVILPATLIIVPLYLRHSVFADVTYPVAESDIIEIRDGISSIFCEQHSLHMNTTFNAFQLRSKPEISRNRKHIRLKKSMTLPDDTLEYWGFYLLKGAIVELKVCSRYDGSRILLVKGDRNLKTCGLLEHNKNKFGAHFAQGYDKVQVTFETVAEVVLSKEENLKFQNNNKTNGNIKVKEIERSHKLHEKSNFDYLNDENVDENHGGEDFSNDEIINVSQHKSLSSATVPNHNDNKLLNSLINSKTVNFDKNMVKTEDIDEVVLNRITNSSSNYNLTKIHETETKKNSINLGNNLDKNESKKIRHRRHFNRKQQHDHRKKEIMEQLYKKNVKIKNVHHEQQQQNPSSNGRYARLKRDIVYDAKISHGGNALNFTDLESNSVSSFENSLLTCYDGQILLAQGFNPSSLCTNVHYLENGTHMIAKHEVEEDGYYYYIFYSDNDLFRNDIHAVFDIYKPTYQYANLTDSKGCVNGTNCTFPINFLSDEIVVVEVPTRDGIEHEEDDITLLVSTCHPRMSVYIIFPVTVLILILSCSFL